MLQANSAIQGVFAHNDEMALGAVEAVGNKKILVVGLMRQTMQSQQSKQENGSNCGTETESDGRDSS